MKKQLPGWAVLLIITLVAGLALGGTNALTKDPIAQQALIKAENARKAALPDAESFEELPLSDGATVDWVYAGLKDGSPVGYVAQKTVNGFGGKVEVIAGVDTKAAPDTFTIGGITVGGSDFSETAGLGARAKEPAFTEQFPAKVYPISYIKAGGTATESTVDALTSATITTTAVVNGVNDIVKYVKADVMGIAGVEMPAKPDANVFSASEKGFRGPVYVEAAFDGAGQVTYMKVGDESFAEDIGAGVIEPDFMIQFIGKQMPLEVSDIDVIAGATISSTAVVKALNTAYAVAGGAEIVVPEPVTLPEKPAEGVFSASDKGFAGPVYVEAAFDGEGKISYISVGDDQFAETEGFGARAQEPEELAPFIGAQMPLELGDVDALTGATFTKTAIVNSLNKAYAASKGEVIEEPVAEEIVMPEKPAEGVFSATEKGFAGPVYVEAAFDGEGKISYISVGDDQFAETEGFGARALTPEEQHPFIGAQMPLELGSVDVLTGATFTKTAIVNGLNKAYAASKGEVEEEPAAEPAPAAEAVPETGVTASVQGFAGPVAVTADFDADGKITSIKIGDDQFAETPGLGAKALEEDFQKQFIGKQMPLTLADIDALAGATITSTAVVDALNQAYAAAADTKAAPAEEPAEVETPSETAEDVYTASVQGFAGPVAVEAAFDADGKITSIKIGDDQFAETPGLGAKALEEDFQKQFIGKQMPLTLADIDALAGATITSTAVVDALNEAYQQVPAAPVEEPVEEPAAEPVEEPAQEPVEEPAEIPAPEAKVADAPLSGEAISFFTSIRADLKITSVLTVEEVTFEEKPVGTDEYQPSAQSEALQALFVGMPLPLDVSVYDDAYTAAAAIAVNEAFAQAYSEALDTTAPSVLGIGESISFFHKYVVAAAFENGTLTTFGAYKVNVNGEGEKAALDCDALSEALVGQKMPLTVCEIAGAGMPQYEAAAVMIALNQAYVDSLAGQQ